MIPKTTLGAPHRLTRDGHAVLLEWGDVTVCGEATTEPLRMIDSDLPRCTRCALLLPKILDDRRRMTEALHRSASFVFMYGLLVGGFVIGMALRFIRF